MRTLLLLRALPNQTTAVTRKTKGLFFISRRRSRATEIDEIVKTRARPRSKNSRGRVYRETDGGENNLSRGRQRNPKITLSSTNARLRSGKRNTQSSTDNIVEPRRRWFKCYFKTFRQHSFGRLLGDYFDVIFAQVSRRRIVLNSDRSTVS